MKQINTVSELRKIMDDVKNNSKYESIEWKLNDEGVSPNLFSILDHMNYLKVRNKHDRFILTAYSVSRVWKTKNIKMSDITHLANSYFNDIIYDLEVEDDDVPEEMCDEYVKLVKQLFKDNKLKTRYYEDIKESIESFDIGNITSINQ